MPKQTQPTPCATLKACFSVVLTHTHPPLPLTQTIYSQSTP